jgi:probable O-glycosylation ligase (exosortase A-associated)
MTTFKQTELLRDSGRGMGIAKILTPRRLGLMFVIVISLVMAAFLVELPDKLQAVLLAAVPAFMFVVVILINANLGIFYYFLYEFLRPVDFIPALRPLKIAMLIELLTLIAWVFLLIKSRRKIIWYPFNNIYAGFILVMAVTIFTALNTRFAFNMTQAILVNFVVFLIATNVVDTEKKLNNLIWLLLFIHLYHALKGLYNYAVIGFVSAGQRTSGVVGSSFIGDENDFALALNVMMPFAFFLFQHTKSIFKKYLSLGILLVYVLGVVSSMSRGGWVGMMAIVFFCIMKSKRKFLSFSIVAVFAVLVVLFAPSDYWSEVKSISNTDEATARSRINYWKAGVAMMVDNPIIGVGAGNGPIRMPEYVHGFRDSNTQWGRTFHGTLPQVMGELGGLGIILYLTMVFFALKILHNIGRGTMDGKDEGINAIANALFASIIGYVITATFLSTAYYPQLWTLFTFTFILYGIYNNMHSKAAVQELMPEAMV